jgi:hypothetical protein
MNKISVIITAFLAITIALACIANAQTVAKPSVPDFTVNMVDRSYEVPLTYVTSTNPFTGEQENSTQGGYHVENKTVDVIIHNQPFTPTNISGSNTQLFYVIRWKGHFENWSESTVGSDDFYYYLNNVGTNASDSGYTVKTYLLSSFGNVPSNGKIDFQVKAQ